MLPAMGQRFRLKSSYDISGITGQSAPDRQGDEGVRVRRRRQWLRLVLQWQPPTRRWDDDNLNQLKEIPSSAFEVVATEADTVTC